MSDSMHSWVDNAVDTINQMQSSVSKQSSMSFDEKISFIGEYLFFGQFDSLLPNRRFALESIVDEIHQIYDVNIGKDDTEEMLNIFLGFAVSPMSECRAEFVQGIMQLEAEDQVEIMQRIQEFQTSVVQRPIEEREECTAENKRQDKHSAGNHYSTERYESIQSDVCETCGEKDQQIERMKAEIKKQLAQWKEHQTKLEEDLSIETNKVVDVELMILKKDEEIFRKDQILQNFEKKTEQQDILLRSKEGLEEKIASLQDEIDILKPQADKLDTVQGQLERTRKRLEELNEIKCQLTSEMINHEKTCAKLALVEQEVESLRKLKVQLEEYRSQFAEATITIDELKFRLSESESNIRRLEQENAKLSGGQLEHLAASQNLAEELKATSEQLRSAERSNGLTNNGVNEFNPVLMQEMEKLKSENKELTERIALCSVDHLQSLEKKLSDQESVVNSLQKKWIATKDSLEEARQNIHSLNAQLLHLNEEYAALQYRFDESVRLSAEELHSLKAAHLITLTTTQEAAAQQLKETVDTYEEEKAELSSSLENMTTKFTTTHTELITLQGQHEDLTVQFFESEKKRKLDTLEFEQKFSRQKTEFDTEVSNLSEQLQQNQQESSATINRLKAEQKARMNSMASDYEEECGKRRKSDRAKKFFEAEVQRLKIQLQVAMTSSGDSGAAASVGTDVKAALREIKSMQQQLDAAHAEIAALRSMEGGDSSSSSSKLLHSSSSSSSASSSYSSSKIGVLGSTESRRAKLASLRGSMGLGVSGDSEMMSGNSAAASAPTMHSHGQDGHEGKGNGSSGSNGGVGGGYLEHAELTDRRVDQLKREKRGMLSKTLEEGKEKMEMSQKLLMNEKEISSLKTDVRKLTLEKERLERKMMKLTESSKGSSSTAAAAKPLQTRDENVNVRA